MIQRLKYKCLLQSPEEKVKCDKRNQFANRRKDWVRKEQHNNCSHGSCRLRGNTGIHLKAFKKPVMVISEASLKIYRNMQRPQKAGEASCLIYLYKKKK